MFQMVSIMRNHFWVGWLAVATVRLMSDQDRPLGGIAPPRWLNLLGTISETAS
jgi:hypothetical protein